MTGDTRIQHVELHPKTITTNDIKVLDNLLLRTESLPDILHLRVAEWSYELTETDKVLLIDSYTMLDDILKEVASFINVKFPGYERHIRAWNDIDFDTKIGPIKIQTNDHELIKKEWQKGLFDLKELIKVLRNESMLLLDESPNLGVIQKLAHQNSNQFDQPVSENVQTKLRSWVEVISWIAGIIGTAVTLYVTFK